MKTPLILAALAMAAPAGAATLDSESINRSTGWTEYFEAGYTIYGKTGYTADAYQPGAAGDKLDIDQKLTAWVRVFGSKANIAEVRGTGYTYVDGSKDYDVKVYAWVGPYKQLLHSYDWQPEDGAIWTEEYIDWTFFSAEKRFYVVVKVKASVKGEVGYYAMGTVNNNFIGGRLAPYARAYAKVTASLDAFVAEAGAYGTLYLVNAEVPIYANVGLNNSTQCAGYHAEIDIDETVSWLYGEAGVYHREFWWDPKEYTLWRWTTEEKRNSLYHPATTQVCY